MHEISVFIASSSSKGLGEPTHMRRLARARNHKVCNVDESPDQNLVKRCWIHQNGCLLEEFAHMRKLTKISWAGPYTLTIPETQSFVVIYEYSVQSKQFKVPRIRDR